MGVLAGVLPSAVSLALFPLQVWDLSDIDKDGHLDRDEFAVVGPCCDSLFPLCRGRKCFSSHGFFPPLIFKKCLF